jgi:hypothetical protein
MRKTESAYEKRSDRGAKQKTANFRGYLVNAKPRQRFLTGFCRFSPLRNDLREFR